MAKSQQDGFAVKRGPIEAANTLGRLLDPHLHSPVEIVAKEESWPIGKTLLLVLGISFVLWAVTFTGFLFLFGP
jgi:hypothetical protein